MKTLPQRRSFSVILFPKSSPNTTLLMITDESEEDLVSRMVRESLALGECCVPSLSFPKHHLTLNNLDPRCYTSLLGKQSSLTTFVSFLQNT